MLRARPGPARRSAIFLTGAIVAMAWGCASGPASHAPASAPTGRNTGGEAEETKPAPPRIVFVKVMDECAMAETARPNPVRRPGAVATLAPNRFHVECAEFDRVAVSQSKMEWCWAACAQMVLAYNRQRVSEQELVNELGDGAADETKVLLALCQRQRRNYLRATKDANYVAWFLAPRPVPTAMVSDRLIQAISQGQPVVVGLARPGGDAATAEHLAVIRGVTYGCLDTRELSHFGDAPAGSSNHTIAQFAVESVDVQDPWPTRGRMTLSGAELRERAVFLATIDSACSTIESSIEELRKRYKFDIRLPGKDGPRFKIGK